MNKIQKAILTAVDKGYTITKDGVVSSRRGVVKPIYKHSNGSIYKFFSVRTVDGVIKVPIHRFHGYIKYGDDIFKSNLVVRHLDGNAFNNKWNNLKIGTHSMNMNDVPKEQRSGSYDYPEKDILKDLSDGLTYVQVMEKYNIVTTGALSWIITKNR